MHLWQAHKSVRLAAAAEKERGKEKILDKIAGEQADLGNLDPGRPFGRWEVPFP